MKREQNRSLNIKRILREHNIKPIRETIEGVRMWTYKEQAYYTLTELYVALIESKELKDD